MSTLLFRLNDVPEDEAEDVRQLLANKGIDCYETHAGFFGLGVAAIWLSNDSQLLLAKAIIDDYQSHRAVSQRKQYEALRASGEIPSFGKAILQHPVRFTGIMLLVLFILLLTLLPFWKTF